MYLQSEILNSLALHWEGTEVEWKTANSRRGYWFTTHTVSINMAMIKERLINSGFYDLATAY